MKLVQTNKAKFIGILFALCICKYASSKQLPGEIYPPNVELEVGGNVNITCQLNPEILKGHNASDLKFWINNTKTPMSTKDVIILNSTTIMYMLRNAKPQVSSLICTCRNDGLQISKIYVGYKPLPVKDFACRSYDFEYMICNFTQPFNHIMTTYNLSYFVDTPQYKYYPQCNYDNKPHIVCNTTLRNQAQYYFILHGANELGNRFDNFTFNNWEIMAPAKPGESLRVLSRTRKSLSIVWHMSKWEKYRARGLLYEILLKPDNFPVRNISEMNVSRLRNEIHLTINDLPYAWYWYDLHIRARINFTNSPWSDSFTYRFQTAPVKPDRPPRVQNGSFYIDSTETQIRLYWEQLKDYERNGDNFTYIITKIKRDGALINLEPLRLEANSAKFSWDKYSQYEFEIRSWNSIGESEEASYLVILPHRKRNAKRYVPRAIQNVYHATNGTYTLTWQSPVELRNLKDYTVYWCYSKPALQNECKGSLHFINVAAGVYQFTTLPQPTQQEHTLNLAVSANYEDFNTGMHWTDCTQDVNSDLEKMEPEIQAINATSIKIQWSTERVCPSILIGYNISYCEIATLNTTAECVVPPSVVSIDNNAKKFELTSLKPYTNYKIEMFMYSHLKLGKLSEAQVVRTYEAAPSPPEQLQLLHIGNTSATLLWLPPSHPNGIIRSYSINLNNKAYELCLSDEAVKNNDKYTFKLTELKSFTSYKVYVTAHNSLASKHSNHVHFTTRIGIPSIPGTAAPLRENNTIIQWSKPKISSGRLEYYEVLITQFRNDQIVKSYMNYIVSSTACVLRQLPICPSAEYKTTVQVRAVNAAVITHEVDMDVEYDKTDSLNVHNYNEHGEDYLRCENISPRDADLIPKLMQQYQNKNMYRLYKSEWQMGSSYSCSANRYSRITTAVLLIVVLIVSLMTIGYFAGKKFKKMANIHCTLPEGLESYFEKDISSNTSSIAAILNDNCIGFNNSDFVKSVLDDEYHLENGNESFESKRKCPFSIKHEQEQRLLESSVGNDSGYLGDLQAMEGCPQLLHVQFKEQVQSRQQQLSLTERRTSIDSFADGTLSLTSNNISNSTQELHDLPGEGSIAANCYIKPENLLDSNGYITADAMKAIDTEIRTTELPHIGYINPTQLQKLTKTQKETIAVPLPTNTVNNLNGYTTLSELEQIMRNVPNSVPSNPASNYTIRRHLQQQPLADPVARQISGYVTQHDLNIFAQKQNSHNNSNHFELAQQF